MKIWIFNVLVAGALAYLFLGESEQTRVQSDLEWARDKVETTLDQNQRVAGKRAEQSAPPVRNIASEPHRIVEKPVSSVTVEPLAAPPAPPVAERVSGEAEIARGETLPTGGARPRENVAEVLPPLDDPEVARRRAIVLDTGEAGFAGEAGTEAGIDTNVTVMAAGERRDALNALAEDMELMFVDKVSR